ncbi:MAG: DUF4390 domain-containing protein [Mariprofundaceae bacterium]|nr:DUF4390 domain-containing protein [Mariprofundaceae bacterium]
MLFFLAMCVSPMLALADEPQHAPQDLKQTDVHFSQGIVYGDVQTFSQEAYILKVLAAGSAMTASWQFEVLEKYDYWLNQSLVQVVLARQVLPDLVTKRWLMRDLSGGVVRYTTDVHLAMRFLTEMRDVAVVDASLLTLHTDYVLESSVYLTEGERTAAGWLAWFNWGDAVGRIDFSLNESGLVKQVGSSE